MNMYYTFSPERALEPCTMKDVERILLGHNPVQLVIDDKCVWDDKYDDIESYNKVMTENADKLVKDLWISIIEEHHSIVKISTWENDNGT